MRFCIRGHVRRRGTIDAGRHCLKCDALRKRKQYESPAEKIKHSARNRLRLYGVSQAMFEQMIKDQNNQCLICRQIPKIFHVDHNHETGKVRGLLCGRCNGYLLPVVEYKPDMIEAARKYLEAKV